MVGMTVSYVIKMLRMQVRSTIVYIIAVHQIICVCAIITIWILQERLLAYGKSFVACKMVLMETQNHRHYFIFIYTKPHFLLVATRFYVAIILDGGECCITRPKVLVVWWAYMRKKYIHYVLSFYRFLFQKESSLQYDQTVDTHTHT